MEQVKCAICQVVNEAGRNTCARCGAPIAVVDNKMPALSEGPAGAGGAEVMLRRGQLIANRYTVHDLIGRGGMGCIYKVKDNTLNEIVALKTLLPEYARDSVVVERFFNEARIARGLSHPHIGRVHDIGIADEVLYISMEYIEGKSLLEMLDTIPPGQRLAVDTVLRIFDELCAALEYAHQFTIHRDIKPGNVMLDTHGSVKLMDFGVSKLMANPNLTTASMVMGTPYYMSPEQLENSASVDARSDLYSVGVMLYEVLTGDIPKGMAKPVSSIAHKVPPALDPIIEKCLEPLPENRYQNAAELREAIGTIRDLFESGMGSSSLTAGGLGKRAPGPGRKAVAALLVSLIVASARPWIGAGTGATTRRRTWSWGPRPRSTRCTSYCESKDGANVTMGICDTLAPCA